MREKKEFQLQTLKKLPKRIKCQNEVPFLEVLSLEFGLKDFDYRKILCFEIQSKFLFLNQREIKLLVLNKDTFFSLYIVVVCSLLSPTSVYLQKRENMINLLGKKTFERRSNL